MPLRCVSLTFGFSLLCFQVMEWEEFTGFVIDQVLALTREAPRADRLKVRPLGARDKPSVSRCLPVDVLNTKYFRMFFFLGFISWYFDFLLFLYVCRFNKGGPWTFQSGVTCTDTILRFPPR